MKKNKLEDIKNAIDSDSIQRIDSGGFSTMMRDSFVDKMMEGDNRCDFKVGDRVKKATYEEGDVHAKGTPGIVVGSMYIEDQTDDYSEAYLVIFNNEENPCFTVKYKLEPNE